MPGSQTTLARLGLPESFTPTGLRIPTRMFPAATKGEWEPFKVREKKAEGLTGDHGLDMKNGQHGQDAKMGDVDNSNLDGESKSADQEEPLYEEDLASEEGAVFPLREGRVVNWSCFFALLTHVYNTLSPPFHTPILVIAQPAWTEQDHETLTQFFFEKFKTPAFCLMDSALATCYAYGVPTATVVDVGFEKCDVTAVSDFLVNDIGRGIALAGCGGEGMTQRLLGLLQNKGFTREMCEQLKRSSICEILPPNMSPPVETDAANHAVNPAAVASTGATGSEPGQGTSIVAQRGVPRGPGINTYVGAEDQDRDLKDNEDNEGVLDVASIVASGKASEFLAKKEREKAEKAAAKKAAADAAAAPKPVRLPNSQRPKATLHYDERRPLDESDSNEMKSAEANGVIENSDPTRQKTAELVRKDIEVGTERFRAADGIMEQIADSVHRSILSVSEVGKRSELWDSLIILGNGSKVRGNIPFFSQRISPSAKKVAPRIQGCSPRHPHYQISHLPVQRHYLHI